MSDGPNEFECVLPTWDYIYDLCREVSNDVKDDDFEPDVVVALARGGWFGGRCVCDFLGLDDLSSLKVEHYVGTAERGDEATVRYPMPEGSVENKDVLIIDDIAETGESMERAYEYVTDQNPNGVRTALLQMLPECDYEPDYVGEELNEWVWVVYPWNFMEDMVELLEKVMTQTDDETFTLDQIRRYLREFYGIERITLEIAQPNRLGEVLTEMERQGIVEQVADETWTLSD
jgi:hypoxanthine phosphoribosyltransferase